ncbi:MAG: hypothetical protein ABGX10_06990 [Paracoccus sp. (in: a-proteobacteria)]|uniref:hypothetical protein n=1 Tax=Paracoccus sp. TaxID=267 RepID=UPI00324211EB
MQNFNLGALDLWKQVAVGEILDLEMPSSGSRTVAFDVIANGEVSINCVAGDDYWLVGCGSGSISCKFTVGQPVGLVFIGEAATDIFVRTFVDAQVIPESVEASYTTIEPRPAGPSDDIKRMMHIMNINMRRREEALRAEFAQQREQQTLEEIKEEKREAQVLETPQDDGGTNE